MADSPLQKAPKGLLGAFALKVLGLNPRLFGEAVVPVVDVFDQYLGDAELQSRTDNTVAALSATTVRTFTVPQNKCWRVLGAGGYMVLNVADVALIGEGMVAIITPIGGLNNAPTIYSFTMPQLGVGFRTFGMNMRPALFLPSGFGVVVQMNWSAAITVAPTATQASILIQEFDL